MSHARCAAMAAGDTAKPSLVQRQEQFQRLAVPVQQRLYRYALRSLQNRQDAEDVTQEALLRAWAHFEQFDLERSFDAWMIRILNNLMIDLIRRRRRRQEVSLDFFTTCLEEPDRIYFISCERNGNPQDRLMYGEISAGFQAAFKALPDLHQTILSLVAQECSYEEIAKAFDCPLGTVRSRVHRARVMLRSNLKARASRYADDDIASESCGRAQ
jgi:RNA polymerase sigma-70 factor, ECF subfamily